MGDFNENLISPDEARTLDGLFACRVRRSPDRTAYRYFDQASKSWLSYTWSEMAAEVARWQSAMRSEGAPRGGRVAIQLRNCPEWVMFDQAALSLGLVTVPIYTDDRPDNIAYILKEADINILLVQDAGRWRRLAEVVGDDGPLKRVLLLDDSDAARRLEEEDNRVRTIGEWLPASGAKLVRRENGDGKLLASIVYTSGTTGRPKG
ncbi:MAG: AMP-binding protein, partial [Sedimenticolaceae bacterium]